MDVITYHVVIKAATVLSYSIHVIVIEYFSRIIRQYSFVYICPLLIQFKFTDK